MNLNLHPLLAVAIFFEIGSYAAAESNDSISKLILLVTDDKHYGDMSCNWNPWIKTPITTV